MDEFLPSSSSGRWKVGDIVFAEYFDKQYYDAVVEEMGAIMIHVRFIGNGDCIMISEDQIKERPPLHPDFKEDFDQKTGHLLYYNTKTGESTRNRPIAQDGNIIGGDELDEVERRAIEHTKKRIQEENMNRREALKAENSMPPNLDVKSNIDQKKSQQPQQMEITSAWVPEGGILGRVWTRNRGRSSFRIPLPGVPCGCGQPGC